MFLCLDNNLIFSTFVEFFSGIPMAFIIKSNALVMSFLIYLGTKNFLNKPEHEYNIK